MNDVLIRREKLLMNISFFTFIIGCLLLVILFEGKGVGVYIIGCIAFASFYSAANVAIKKLQKNIQNFK